MDTHTRAARVRRAGKARGPCRRAFGTHHPGLCRGLLARTVSGASHRCTCQRAGHPANGEGYRVDAGSYRDPIADRHRSTASPHGQADLDGHANGQLNSHASDAARGLRRRSKPARRSWAGISCGGHAARRAGSGNPRPNARGDWWQLAWTDGHRVWVAATVVRVLGPTGTVAVAQGVPTPPPAPTVTPQPTAPAVTPGPDFKLVSVRLWGAIEKAGLSRATYSTAAWAASCTCM